MSIMNNWGESSTMYAHTIVSMIQKGRVYTIDEMKAIIGRDKLLSSDVMDTARGMVRQMIEGHGLNIPELPPLSPEADQQQLANFARMQKTNDKINGIETGEYSTTVILSPYSATNRAARMETTFALNDALLAGNHAPVDREILIDSTDVERKDEIIERVPAQQGVVAR